MIRVDRSRKCPRTKKKIYPKGNWKKLASSATRKANKEKGKHQADRSVYRHKNLLAALKKLFFGKCAYCERKLNNLGVDVEHFRPGKKPKEEKGKHNGYYWLIYKWENLYYSCEDCNRVRKAKSEYDDEFNKSNYVFGKGCSFKLGKGGVRAKKPKDSLAKEKALLIDPCKENPGRYIRFGADLKPSAIAGNQRGNYTIKTLGLDHSLYVRSRKSTYETVKRLLNQYKQAKLAKNKLALRHAKTNLKKMLNPRCEHNALVQNMLADPIMFGVNLDPVNIK